MDFKIKKKLVVFMISAITFFAAVACNDDSNEATYFPASTGAVIATVAPDYSSGAHSVISIAKPRTAINDLLPVSNSSMFVRTYGNYFYRFESMANNNITKIDLNAPDTVIYQYAIENEGETNPSNPHDMLFVSEDKAYILCYGSNKVWIVNPSAATDAEFKTGELDLSSYADSDGLAEIDNGIIAGNTLFISLQRLDRDNYWAATNTSYIAVFDISTDTEIDTGQAEPDSELKGIALDITNPSKLRYSNDTLFVSGTGNYSNNEDGGIQLVNISTYEKNSTLLYTGTVTDIEIVSDTKGYFILYSVISFSPWTEVTYIYSFNPSDTSQTPEKVTGFLDGDDWSVSDIAADSFGMLWILDGSENHIGIHILNTADESLDEGPVSTNLKPSNIAFCSE